MSLRQWANHNQVAAIGVVGLLLVVALGALYLQTREPHVPLPDQAWFFDVGSGELFMADYQQIPPIDAPSGAVLDHTAAGGVRAHVFTCGGDCNREADRHVGYFEVYEWDVRERRLAASEQFGGRPGELSPDILMEIGLQQDEGRLVAAVDQPDLWLPADSPEGRQLIVAGRRCDDGSRGTSCWAKMR